MGEAVAGDPQEHQLQPLVCRRVCRMETVLWLVAEEAVAQVADATQSFLQVDPLEAWPNDESGQPVLQEPRISICWGEQNSVGPWDHSLERMEPLVLPLAALRPLAELAQVARRALVLWVEHLECADAQAVGRGADLRRTSVQGSWVDL